MIKKLIPVFFIFAVTCLIFFKVFTKGLYPVPGDLLVSFYFPWYSGGWEGYNPWTTHKELLAADSIRQIYLWKEFAASEFKKGNFPLWNPYTFSGQPLLANFQSSVFYPLNIFYFITNARNAWILLIVTQPFLGGMFMYLAIRSFSIGKIASTYASVVFMFSSYLITWMENGNISHSYVWLPLSFWAINNYFLNFKYRYLLILAIALALTILAGHPQTAIYIYLISAVFWVYKSMESKKFKVSKMIIFIFPLVSSLLICAVQLLPTAAFYRISPISLPFSREVFDRSILPYKNLITFFASDFFGHPANNNFWSQSYGDFTPYFGAVPLVFTLWAIFRLGKYRFIKFATIVASIFILAALHGPITYLIKILEVPLLNATTPSRFTSISIFIMIILSAFGLNDLLKNFDQKKYVKQFLIFLILISFVYIGLWAFVLYGPQFLNPKELWQSNLAVTKRNLILPTLMFAFIPMSLILLRNLQSKIPKNIAVKNIFLSGVFLVTIIGGVYYTNKFLPASSKEYIFPNHPIFTWIKENAGIDRFYGGGTAQTDFNFPTHFEIYSSEGYDTLRIERYAQLLASSNTGSVPKTYARSDGVFPNQENGYRKRLFDLLGVKYLLDKEDEPKTGHDWKVGKFTGDNVEGYWQDGKFLIYRRLDTLPRIFQTTKYIVAADDQIIKNIYDPNFNLQTLLLEKDPPLKIDVKEEELSQPKVTNYIPGDIQVETDKQFNTLLFISDAHDKDWQVTIDSQKAQLLRAHYAFLSTAVPAGKHVIAFKYQPQSFKTGLYITILSILTLTILTLYWYKTKKI